MAIFIGIQSLSKAEHFGITTDKTGTLIPMGQGDKSPNIWTGHTKMSPIFEEQ